MIFEVSLIAIQACLVASLYPIFLLIKNKKIKIGITVAFALVSLFLHNRTLFFIVSLFFLFSEHSLSKKFIKKVFILPAILITFGLVFLNLNSFIGRLFIWKNILNNFHKIPWKGFGHDTFKYYYGSWQAAYFSTNKVWSKYHLVADAPSFAFNEILHFYLEFGIIVLLIFTILFYFNIRIILRNKIPLCQTLALSNLAILIFSLVSYPLHSIWVLFVFFSNHILIASFYLKQNIFGILATLLLFIFVTISFVREMKWKEVWFYAMSLPINATPEKEELFGSAITHFYDNQYFLNGYCAYLLSEQKTEKVLTISEPNRIYFNQYEYNLIIGNAYFMKSNFDSSKKYFLQAHYLIPNRFIPLDNLFNIAILSNDKVNAIQYAEKIISMPVKVPSMRVNKIKSDAKLFLTK